MGGTLRFLSDVLLGSSSQRQHSKKRRQFNTVELKVKMDCDGCELKIRNTLANMRGMRVAMHTCLVNELMVGMVLIGRKCMQELSRWRSTGSSTR
uniref:HMA domain-containing protein n=1 Tax=Aegilops tauschii subsp. strangulata TaxID=200361 RepID=A0A453HKQ8_AEGTS